MARKNPILFLLILWMVFLTGCVGNQEIPPFTSTSSLVPGLPQQQETITETIIPTNHVKTLTPTPTISATQVEEQEVQPTATAEPGDQGDFEETPQVTLTPTEESQPSPTPMVEQEQSDTVPDECSEKAAFYTDVTVPDGTFFYQGERFTKTWRFRNEGTCTWTTDYALVFHSGDNMSAPIEIPFTASALPGEQIDLSVEMNAPTRGGEHYSNWEFKSPQGQRFGVGITGTDYFWVQINVRFLDENDEPQPDPSTLPPPVTPTDCEVQRDETYEIQVVDLINQARLALDLNPLALNSQLAASALAHSMDMACSDFVGHAGSDGSHWTDRISVQGYSYSYATENIYVGFPDFGGTPQGAYDWWMDSQVHRDNILDPSVTELGVGYVYNAGSSYGGYYTVNFARP